MFHDTITAARAEPASQHPMAKPAPDGVLRDLVIYFRAEAVRDRLQVAMIGVAGSTVALFATGCLRAWLAGRL